jgi:hypothetical protein
MKQVIVGLALSVLVPCAGFAQDVKIPERIEKLSDKASETVNVTLDGPLLQLAGQFLNSKNSDEQQARNVVSKLKGIHVRSFEFAREGEYSDADVAAFRSQLRSPAWSRIVDTRSKEDREHVEIFVKQDHEMPAGLVIISAAPKGLTIVSIDGMIDLKQLASLGGQFGIPKIGGVDAPVRPPASKTPSDGKDSAE